MKIYLNNQLEEIDPPSPVGPCETFEEALRRGQPGPSASIFEKDKPQLSVEARAILENSAPELDPRREFNFLMDSGQIEKAFAASGSSPLHKSADFQKADAVLREFRETHDKLNLREQLEPLVAKAVTKLSQEDGSLLRRALNALDLAVLSFFLGKAFAV